MQRRNRIHAPRELQPQHGYAEWLLVVRRILAPKTHQRIVRKSQLLTQGPKVLLNQIRVEPVMACWHGSVRGKQNFTRNLTRRCVEVDSFFHHATANRLE